MEQQTFAVVGGGLAAAKAVEELPVRRVRRGPGGLRRRAPPALRAAAAVQGVPHRRRPAGVGVRPRARLVRRQRRRPAPRHAGHGDRHRRATRWSPPRPPAAYDKLLLATGSTPRHLRMADDSGAPVAYLRTIEDSQRLKGAFAEDARVAVVGAGWIGLETAVRRTGRGCTSPCWSPWTCRCCACSDPRWRRSSRTCTASHGVDLRLGVQVSAIEQTASRAVVRLADGATADADLLVVGIGVTAQRRARPRRRPGHRQRRPGRRAPAAPPTPTSSPPATWPTPCTRVLGRRIRVEHWDTAIEQGKAAARACSAARSPTTGSPTSTPTSTTSAWSTSAASGRTATTTSWCAAAHAPAPSRPTGCATGSCARHARQRLGRRRRAVDVRRQGEHSPAP